MKRTVCALLAVLTGVGAMTGATVLSGRVDGTAVDVAYAVPITVTSALAVQGDEFVPSPDAARLSVLVSAAMLRAQQTAETAEDAAANNADRQDTKKADESKKDEEAKKEETTEKEAEDAKEETPKQEEGSSLSGVQALGIINGTSVRMRSGAGTGSSILKTLDKSTALAVLGKDGNWYKVSYDGVTGYVHGDYVTTYESAADLSYTGRVTADVLNIRTAAGSGNGSVGSAKSGTYVTVTGIEKGWYAVSVNGLSGYVSGDYLALCPASGSASSAPTETPDETPAVTAPVEDTADTTDTADTPTAEEPVSTPVSGTVSGSTVAALAQQYLGTPYVYGGSSPSGFDCSGFTMYIFSQVGISLPHGATSQLSYGTAVSRSELQPGDLVFFQDYGAVASHTGIYIGNDQFVHASSSYYNGHCVVISSLTETYYNNHYYTARRH